MKEKQITFAPHGHVLTNTSVWSPDGKRIVYDIRSNPDGSVFDGTRIETVDVRTGTVQILYESKNGAWCGVATYSPTENTVVFIHGPERPTHDWHYGFGRRRGVLVSEARPGDALNLEARNLLPPFTPGALRGGTHVHVFSPDGRLVSFTYHDLIAPPSEDQRNIGVSLLGRGVVVPKTHERNHDGGAFSLLLTRTTKNPEPGSNEISRACEEGWVGADGRVIAFQGEVISAKGKRQMEVFVVELPEDLTVAGEAPLEGTPMERPSPPKGTVQRRLTFTEHGLSGPRHWLRSSPDGSQIGFLMRDYEGIVQLWTVSPAGENPRRITLAKKGVESAFSWSADGKSIAMAIDGRIAVVSAADGASQPISASNASPIRPEACVFSPSGDQIAYSRIVNGHNQIFIADYK
jgi:WD40 repeat protein